MDKPFLSIVIPAYNEEKRIAETLRKVHAFLHRSHYEYEVVLVSDGSTDKTVEVIKETTSMWQNFRLIVNKENNGKGYVVRQGMLEAKGEWRLFMDADGATPIEMIERMIKQIDRFQVIIGSRYIEKGLIQEKQPFFRQFVSRAGNLFIQAMILPGIKDTQCGFKMFSKKATEEIFPLQRFERWSFDMELLTIAKKKGYKIVEVPVIWHDVAGSKVKAGATLRSLKDVFVIKWNSISGKYN